MRPQLSLFFGAICIGFAPIFVKLSGIGPTSTGVFRCLFGALFFLIFFSIRKSFQPRIQSKLLLPPKLIGLLALPGLVFAVDLFLWHRAVIFCGAGIGTILANTQVFYLSVLGLIFFHEKLSARLIVSIFMAFVGVNLLVGFQAPEQIGENFYWGVIYGLLTGLTYAAYILSLSYVEKNYPHVPTSLRMVYVSFFSSLGMWVGALALNEHEVPAGIDWLWVVLLGLLPQFFGWFSITRSLPHVPVSRAGLIILMQPVLATILGAFLFSEKLGLIQVLGATLTLIGIYLGGLKKKTTPKSQHAHRPSAS